MSTLPKFPLPCYHSPHEKLPSPFPLSSRRDPAPAKTGGRGPIPLLPPPTDMSPLPKFPLPCYHPYMKNSFPLSLVLADAGTHPTFPHPTRHSPAEPAPVKTTSRTHPSPPAFDCPTFFKRIESTPETIICRHKIGSIRLSNRIPSTPEISYSNGICYSKNESSSPIPNALPHRPMLY